MNYQEKVDFLNSYNDHTLRLLGLSKEVERWRQIAASTATNNDGMPGGSTEGRKVQNAAINAADIVAEINKDIETVKAKREVIRSMIDTAQNWRYKLLLEQRYINGLTVQEIANQNNKSVKWTRECIKKAVNSLKCQ